MRVLDDEGRLFGRVNVIDAVVVLVLLAVVLAGAAVVASPPGDGGSGPDGTRPDTGENGETAPPVTATDVTVDLGAVPSYVASAIAAGDELNLTSADGTLTLTDVYVNPSGDGVAVRAAGELRAPEDARPALGDAVELRGPRYAVHGRLVAIDGDGEPLAPSWRTATVAWHDVPTERAEPLVAGAEERTAGRTTARLTSVETAPAATLRYSDERGRIVEVTRPGRVDVRLVVAVRALETSAGPRFHGDRLGVGHEVALDLGDVRASGTVVDVAEPEAVGGS